VRGSAPSLTRTLHAPPPPNYAKLPFLVSNSRESSTSKMPCANLPLKCPHSLCSCLSPALALTARHKASVPTTSSLHHLASTASPRHLGLSSPPRRNEVRECNVTRCENLVTSHVTSHFTLQPHHLDPTTAPRPCRRQTAYPTTLPHLVKLNPV
jgi:hypothetical protein